VAELKAVDPNTYVEYRLNDTTNAFQAVFIAPGPLRQAIPHLRHFFALDGTHTRSKYRMILAITVALDANDEVLPIYWGLIPTENEFWWRWYCCHIGLAFPSLKERTDEKWIAISDRDKGLVNGIKDALGRVHHIHCCQHIADNIYARFGKDCKKLWWPIARAKDLDQRKAAMDQLKKQKLATWKYVVEIDTSIYSACDMNTLKYSRFGHDTSNIVECVNSIWGEYRDMPPLIMLDSIYTWIMNKFSQRRTAKATSSILAPTP